MAVAVNESAETAFGFDAVTSQIAEPEPPLSVTTPVLWSAVEPLTPNATSDAASPAAFDPLVGTVIFTLAGTLEKRARSCVPCEALPAPAPMPVNALLKNMDSV